MELSLASLALSVPLLFLQGDGAEAAWVEAPLWFSFMFFSQGGTVANQEAAFHNSKKFQSEF